MPREAYVLVVDDDPEMLALVSKVLDAAGYQVTTATDAWQEVVQAQGLRVGLVITDIQMPGGRSGVDAVRELRALPTLSPQLPVIFMTAMDLDAARRMVPFDPYVRIIGKPINFETLRAAIKELTGVDRPL
ncbi:MAG: response regulator [Elusimicrobia bacterium]|nr:response regulator [Elusimicrobiota bacterium]